MVSAKKPEHFIVFFFFLLKPLHKFGRFRHANILIENMFQKLDLFKKIYELLERKKFKLLGNIRSHTSNVKCEGCFFFAHVLKDSSKMKFFYED